MKILVTGGAGYIGSHTCVVLLAAGHEIVVLDNLCNASAESLRRVQEIGERALRFVKGDVRNADDLANAFRGGIDAVVHFAALKAGDAAVWQRAAAIGLWLILLHSLSDYPLRTTAIACVAAVLLAHSFQNQRM